MALEQTGLRLTVEGASQAIAALHGYDKAVASVAKTQGALTSRLGGKSLTGGIENTFKAFNTGGGGLSKTLASLTSSLPQVSSAMLTFSQVTGTSIPLLGSASGAVGVFSGALAAIPPPLLAAGAALVVASAGLSAFLSLGQRGAALQPTIAAFGNLFGASVDTTEVLGKLREQTRGTISDFELMRLSVSSLKGTTTTFKDVVGKDLGSIIDLTSRIAQASGDSADVVREKFLLGLRRQSKLLLDDVGVMVDAEKAYRDYAKAAGVATNALTDQQKQAAYATEAIKQLKAIGAEIGSPAKTLEDLKTPFVVIQNILDKLALAVQPLFGPLAAGVAGFFKGIETGANLVIPAIASFVQVLAAVASAVSSAWQVVAVLIYQFTPLGLGLQFVASIAPYVVAAFQLMAGAISSVANAVSSAIQSVIPALGGFENQTGATVERIAGGLAQGGAYIIGSFAAGLLNGGALVIQAVTKIATIVADFLQGFSPPKKGPLSNIDKGGENVAKAWADGFLGGFAQTASQAAAFVSESLGDIAKLTAKQVQSEFAKLDSALQPFNEQLTLAKGTFEQIAGVAEPALKILNKQIEEAFKAGDLSRVNSLDAQAASLKALRDEQQKQLDTAELSLALAKAQQAQERSLLSVQQARLGKVKDAANGAAGAVDKEAKAEKEAAKAAGSGGGAPVAEEAKGGFTPGKAPDLLGNEAIDKAKEVLVGGATKGLNDSGYSESLANFNAQSGELQSQLGRIAASKPGVKIAASIEPIKTALSGIQTVFSNTSTSIATGLATIQSLFDGAFGEAGTITASLTTLFAEGGLMGVGGAVQTAIASVFGEQGSLALGIPFIQGLFAGLAPSIETALNNVNSKLLLAGANFEALKTTAIRIVADMITEFTNFTSGVGGALAGLGAALKTHFTDPFLTAVNGVLSLVQEGLNNIISSLPGILGIGLITIPKVEIPGAAKGGIGLKGMHLVGEQGPELVNFGRAANVFPADLSRAIMDLSQQVRTVYAPAGGQNGNGGANTNNQTINSTFNVGSANQARLLERQRLVFMGI